MQKTQIKQSQTHSNSSDMTTTIPASLQNDIEIMDAAAAELARITERTEFALSVVTQAIRTREACAKGLILKELRDQIPDGEWLKFLNREDVALNHETATRFINAAQLVEDAAPLYGEDMLMNFSYSTLDSVNKLPANAKLEVLDNAEESGKAPTLKEVKKVAKKTETKLSKAAEDLAAAKAKKKSADEKFEEVKADPEVEPGSREYGQANTSVTNANTSVKNLEARIVQLESELEREQEQKKDLTDSNEQKDADLTQAQAKLTKTQDQLGRLMEETEKLRFDEDTARSQRIGRVSNQLILTLPQTLADLQKFVADQEHFEEKVRTAITDQIKQLSAYLNEHFSSTKAKDETDKN